ncbi:hypothetical protein LTS08_000698 [Lithohypha guttulata]|nr:hypothetical protein LTS08_000698 [Lithohypha guttulata]
MADVERRSRTKHRKSTCAGCRRRKSKCDGRTPSRTTCIAYKDECIYDKPPSLAYVRALEEEVHQLQNQLKSLKTQAWVNKSPQLEEKKVLPAGSPITSASSSRQTEYGLDSILPYRSPPSRTTKWEADISVDDRGSISFHGSTSAVHEPPNLEQAAQITSQQLMSPRSQQEEEQTKHDLRQNAQNQRQLEDFAIANTASRVNLPKDVSEELLKFHWCWIHPLFAFVYRPAFTRGMTLVNASQPGLPDPPYFSETLLKVMTSHCARFLNHDIYQHHFNMKFTPSQFVEQTTQDARQSAREIVFGRSSQGWLYGGMAFRMALDMGIHLPSDKLQTFVKSLSNEDIEIRKRLFWSCYTWDKVLSLYLGRMPAFTPLIDEVPLSFLDDFTDTDPWSPYYGEAPGIHAKGLPPYPPTPGYIVSCFQQLSKLCVIIDDLMQNIYSAEAAAKRTEDLQPAQRTARSEEPFMRVSRSLHDWWAALPIHLKVDINHIPKLAPPTHIMSLNLLYHTIVILLHRPILLASDSPNSENTSRSYTSCLYATAAIHDLLLLQANTFGLEQITYLNAYCAYMAATISVLRFERELQPHEDHNLTAKRIGLDYLLDVITQSSTRMPGLERSNAIIRKRMQGVVDAHLRAHSHLSPNSIEQQASALGPPTSQIALAEATAFQQMSNPGIGHIFDPNNQQLTPQTSPSDPSTVNSIPSISTPVSTMQQQYTVTTTLLPDLQGQMPLPAFVDDFLPAFPGQQFPVGSEYYFGNDGFDTQSKMHLMGHNLDPHPKIDPGAIDWQSIGKIEVAHDGQAYSIEEMGRPP